MSEIRSRDVRKMLLALAQNPTSCSVIARLLSHVYEGEDPDHGGAYYHVPAEDAATLASLLYETIREGSTHTIHPDKDRRMFVDSFWLFHDEETVTEVDTGPYGASMWCAVREHKPKRLPPSDRSNRKE